MWRNRRVWVEFEVGEGLRARIRLAGCRGGGDLDEEKNRRWVVARERGSGEGLSREGGSEGNNGKGWLSRYEVTPGNTVGQLESRSRAGELAGDGTEGGRGRSQWWGGGKGAGEQIWKPVATRRMDS